MKKYLLPIVALLLAGGGCVEMHVTNYYTSPTSTVSNQPDETTITYYVPKNADVRSIYCNGADMNSGGFKNALTVKKTKTIPGTFSTEALIQKTLSFAAQDPNSGFADGVYERVVSTTFSNGVVTLRPAGGWAGSSIFMCAWRPYVEKQLEQFPEVKQVKWETES